MKPLHSVCLGMVAGIVYRIYKEKTEEDSVRYNGDSQIFDPASALLQKEGTEVHDFTERRSHRWTESVSDDEDTFSPVGFRQRSPSIESLKEGFRSSSSVQSSISSPSRGRSLARDSSPSFKPSLSPEFRMPYSPSPNASKIDPNNIAEINDDIQPPGASLAVPSSSTSITGNNETTDVPQKQGRIVKKTSVAIDSASLLRTSSSLSFDDKPRRLARRPDSK
jgi:hypothetical protein